MGYGVVLVVVAVNEATREDDEESCLDRMTYREKLFFSMIMTIKNDDDERKDGGTRLHYQQ